MNWDQTCLWHVFCCHYGNVLVSNTRNARFKAYFNNKHFSHLIQWIHLGKTWIWEAEFEYNVVLEVNLISISRRQIYEQTPNMILIVLSFYVLTMWYICDNLRCFCTRNKYFAHNSCILRTALFSTLVNKKKTVF